MSVEIAHRKVASRGILVKIFHCSCVYIKNKLFKDIAPPVDKHGLS